VVCDSGTTNATVHALLAEDADVVHISMRRLLEIPFDGFEEGVELLMVHDIVDELVMFATVSIRASWTIERSGIDDLFITTKCLAKL
jgi:hypothetical protein